VRCTRANDVFGVVLVLDGSETDREVKTATIGTTARIVDFQTLEDGLLGLLCRGERRFPVRIRVLVPPGGFGQRWRSIPSDLLMKPFRRRRAPGP